MSNVDQAWEANKDRCGREMHEGWRRQKLANGFADHPFQGEQDNWPCEVTVNGKACGLSILRHHPDMIDWNDLPPEQQAINYQGGEIPFRLGYAARDEEVRKCRDALALLNSMVRSGESHSAVSEAMVREATR